MTAAKLALGSLFAARLAVVVWGLDRGFDLGDGGFFLLNLNHPERAAPFYGFYALLTRFDPPLRFGVVEARGLRLLSEAVASAALALAVFAWARTRFPGVGRAGLGSFLGIGLLGSLLSVAARAFGYNDATTLLGFGVTACLFGLVSARPDRAGRRLAWGLAAGFGSGLQLFVKPPSALLLLGVAMLAAARVLRARAPARLAVVGAILGGVGLAILLLVAVHGGVEPLAANLALMLELREVAGYGVADLLRVYVLHDIGSHVNLARFAAAFAGALALAHRLLPAGPERLDRALAIALLVGVAVLIPGAATYHAANVHPTLVALFCLVLLLGTVFLVLVWREAGALEASRWELVAPLGALLVLPFVAMAGTNVALTLRLPSHVLPAFLLLAVATAFLAPRGHRRFCAASLGVLAITTSVLFVQHHWLRPYGLPSPLHRQSHAVAGLPGVRTDRATRAFLEAISERMAGAGFAPGAPVVALDFMPGLVHYLGGRAPGLPFLMFDAVALNCWALNRADAAAPPFLILGQDMSLPQRACIEAFDFPRDFRLVATLRNPYEDAIAYHFGGPPMPYVQLFAPAGPPAEE